MEYVAIGCGVVQAVVFAVAVAGKTRGAGAFHAFARSLVETRLVKRRWRTGAATCVILAEAAVAPLLLAPGSAAFGFAVAASLSALFTGAVALTLLRRIRASCLCFGARRSPMGWPHVVRNAILTAVGVLGHAATTAVSAASPPVHAEGVVVAVLAGAVGALLLIRFDDLAHIFQPVDSPDRSVLR
ncbi:MauE/DoxX family redox-associated membrane protein [Streptosporangium carneum]|uniref:Methylamine utilisation protein MauE domain-containing protein n=1 Tax=Streptosporangium carneum TaxID=47481 RepID=A0A9W6MC98_9ACTN|nr:MauE/DoxX family redox-associated membrane protein [Streptosporangium carneum]GLK08832.1 hypothetical protein GCM10017600_22370 [Streptosporangium carneum]